MDKGPPLHFLNALLHQAVAGNLSSNEWIVLGLSKQVTGSKVDSWNIILIVCEVLINAISILFVTIDLANSPI